MENNELSAKDTLKKIDELEKELKKLRLNLSKSVSSVHVPENMKEPFSQAEKSVLSYFQNLVLNPSKGSIDIEGERYILVRASALSYDFFHTIINLYSEKTPSEAFSEGRNFLFDIGYAIGRQDAKRFHEKLNLTNPIEKLSAGPIHFAYTGWAYVEILPESNPVADENFFLKYNHPYSFEADSWIKKGKKADQPVCIMNAAYSAAWCQESFGMSLSAVEITCRAKGDKECTFIMAPTDKIKDYLKGEQKKINSTDDVSVPFFFERKLIEEKLRTNEQLLKDAQGMAQLGSWFFNLETHELIWTDELYRIFEFPNEPNPNLYQDYLNRFTPDELPLLQQCVDEAITLGKGYQMRHSIILDNGLLKWLSCSGVPVKNHKGQVYALKGIVQDISEKVAKEIELDSFFEVSIDLMCIANDQGFFIKLSPSWEKLLGHSIDELCAHPFIHFVHPDDIDKTYAEMNRLNDGELTINFENRYRCKNGEYKTLSWNATPNTTTGLIYCTTRDVTKQKQIENQLKSSINEKETLLKEIHHRVKNNLQVISSLLSLQAKMNNKETDLSSLYEDSMNRIKSMSALHELFYQSLNTNQIDFKDYINKLILDLMLSFKGENHGIKVKINVKEVFINLDTAVPLGLLINEIITNSLKHGLQNGEKGEIYISISKAGNQYYTLKIGDNGIGFNEKTGDESMGLSIINDLSEQLEGEITRDFSKKGTHYILKFKEQNA